MSLRQALIRLAYQKPALRPALLPLLGSRKQAALKGWKKGLVPVSLGVRGEAFMTYQEGITFGVWGIVKREGKWSVTHIPSGRSAYWAKDVKVAKAFVEAILAMDTKLATERSESALLSTYRSIFMQTRILHPDSWPTLDPKQRIPNTHFEYEGDLPVRVKQDTQVPLKSAWKKLLRDIAEQGEVPSRAYSPKLATDLFVKDLIKYTRRGTIVFTPKGEQSYRDGYFTEKLYVET